jgi:alpha-N-acetylglucosaminidase
MAGIGIAPEAIETNPVVYDLMAEMGWRKEAPEVKEWVHQYAQRRYGKDLPAAQKAWEILTDTVYACPSKIPGPPNSLVCARPAIRNPQARIWTTTNLYYDPARLVEAWHLLLGCSDELGSVDTYRYDLTDMTRQVLADLAKPFHKEIVAAYNAKDQEKLKAAGQRMLELIRDMDEMVGTREEFLLGKWIEDAKSWGIDEREKALLEWNARNQITLWLPEPGEVELEDYANRQWSGLLEGYYLHRWQAFIQALSEDLAGGPKFNQKRFNTEIGSWCKQWAHANNFYPSTPSGSTVEVSERLYEKYKNLTEQAYQ